MLRRVYLIFSLVYVILIIPIRLMDKTDVEESHEVYVTKLALSLGRGQCLFLFIHVLN